MVCAQCCNNKNDLRGSVGSFAKASIIGATYALLLCAPRRFIDIAIILSFLFFQPVEAPSSRLFCKKKTSPLSLLYIQPPSRKTSRVKNKRCRIRGTGPYITMIKVDVKMYKLFPKKRRLYNIVRPSYARHWLAAAIRIHKRENYESAD